MTISEALIPEFDLECATTRRVLERVPEHKFAWKPHEKSFSMGALATHIATTPDWAVKTIEVPALDFAPPGSPPPENPLANSSAQLLEWFDKGVREARIALAGASDEHLLKPWSLLMGGQVLFTMPRVAVLRTWVLNHTYHHRGQLSVYLRLNNIAVPSIYGPSADEQG